MAGFELSSVRTLDEALDGVVAAYSEREALVFGDTRVTYQELGQRVHALAAGLMRLGIQKGDRVAVILPNCLEFIDAFFAIPKAGGAIVPLNPLFRHQEMQHILSDAEATTVILAPQVWGNDVLGIVKELRPELPHLQHVILHAPKSPEGISYGSPPVPTHVHAPEAEEGILLLADVMASGRGQEVRGIVSPEDLFGLIYTSGTTGVPKGAIHTQATMLAPVVISDRLRHALFDRPSVGQMARLAKTMARSAGRFMRYAGKPQTLLSPSPFHALAGYGAMLSALMFGYRFVVVERFHPVRVLELVQKERVNVLSGTPTMFSMMMSLPTFERYDTSSLLYCALGAAPCPPPLVREVRERFGCPTLISFGATETSGAALATRMDDPDAMQIESVGRVLTDVRVKIVDDQRRELPPGQVGELACHMDGIMKGYYKAPEATAQVVDAQGWYYTGDLAVIDARGYVRIVGRKKDMIIRGGQNIFPLEIETFLQSHPKVQFAAVVGVPDPLGGESVWAFVVPKPEVPLTPQEVLAHCRGRIAPFKVPAEVRVVAELPMTPTAKVQKFRLREAAIAELEARGIVLPDKEFVMGANE